MITANPYLMPFRTNVSWQKHWILNQTYVVFHRFPLDSQMVLFNCYTKAYDTIISWVIEAYSSPLTICRNCLEVSRYFNLLKANTISVLPLDLYSWMFFPSIPPFIYLSIQATQINLSHFPSIHLNVPKGFYWLSKDELELSFFFSKR